MLLLHWSFDLFDILNLQPRLQMLQLWLEVLILHVLEGLLQQGGIPPYPGVHLRDPLVILQAGLFNISH